MKVSKSNLDLIVFNNAVGQVNVKIGETKLGKALVKQCKIFEKALEAYNDAREDAQIKHCSVDEKKNIIRVGDKNALAYTVDAQIALNKEIRSLFKTEVEVEVTLTKEQLADCPDDFKDYFMEFIGADVDEVSATSEETSEETK